jgi:hypothetical protein
MLRFLAKSLMKHLRRHRQVLLFILSYNELI